MAKELSIRACPHCGSMDTWPALLFGGPLPWVDHNDGGYICRTCGRQAVPLDFDSLDNLREYQKSIASKGEVAGGEKDFLHIPIVPVDTISLFSIPLTDISFLKEAEVVGVQFDGTSIRRVSERAPFLRYRRAVSGVQYNASEVLLMDISGIANGRPNFEALKQLIRRRYDVWLDLGMRSIHDLFDSFTMEVSRAVASTMTAPSLKLFEEAYELSDRCVPCIQVFGDVIWPRPGVGPRKLEEVVHLLEDIGFEDIGVMDLSRLGTRCGVSPDLVARLQSTQSRIIVGGGVVESDLEPIRELGFRGAFMDPFSPVISRIIEYEETTPQEDLPTINKRTTRSRAEPTDG